MSGVKQSKRSPTPSLSQVLGTNNNAGGLNITNLGSINGVKEFIATISQSGTDAPTITSNGTGTNTPFKNTLGGNVTFGYGAAGSYSVDSDTELTMKKIPVSDQDGVIFQVADTNIEYKHCCISSDNNDNTMCDPSTEPIGILAGVSMIRYNANGLEPIGVKASVGCNLVISMEG